VFGLDSLKITKNKGADHENRQTGVLEIGGNRERRYFISLGIIEP
jgi:hypothetical protein